MKFQVFTDADAPNGEDLFFEYEVVSVMDLFQNQV